MTQNTLLLVLHSWAIPCIVIAQLVACNSQTSDSTVLAQQATCKDWWTKESNYFLPILILNPKPKTQTVLLKVSFFPSLSMQLQTQVIRNSWVSMLAINPYSKQQGTPPPPRYAAPPQWLIHWAVKPFLMQKAPTKQLRAHKPLKTQVLCNSIVMTTPRCAFNHTKLSPNHFLPKFLFTLLETI